LAFIAWAIRTVEPVINKDAGHEVSAEPNGTF
jgi:hypothetical protein